MAEICEIRPRKTRDGFEVTWGTLGLWYREERQAIGYAEDCLKMAEFRVYDEKGNCKQVHTDSDREQFCHVTFVAGDGTLGLAPDLPALDMRA